MRYCRCEAAVHKLHLQTVSSQFGGLVTESTFTLLCPGSEHIGQERIIQGTSRPSDTSIMGRIVQGTPRPRDETSETFRSGTHRSGTNKGAPKLTLPKYS
jgi:hypothetical protein